MHVFRAMLSLFSLSIAFQRRGAGLEEPHSYNLKASRKALITIVLLLLIGKTSIVVVLPLITGKAQNTFKILHFGLNFVSDLAQLEGSKVHCLPQKF